MYIPHGKDVKVYDGTSLYPSQMKFNKFPVGPIYTFEGDVTILDKDKHYWIAESEVKTKRDLERPYLQIHHKFNGSIRTVALNGKFEMKIHCCEYYNSLDDYEINIKNGYLFQSDYIFKDFVDDLFKLRKSYPKDHPMNLVCKLIMNSLYGRFGMRLINNIQKFLNKEDFLKLTEDSNCDIEDFLDLDENGFFVNYINKNIKNNLHKVCVAIASAVTAQGRVAMSKFKKNHELVILYSDTDSVFILGDLPIEMIGNELGKFKLEYIFKEVVMLGPKLYMGITTDDKIIAKVKGYKNAKEINFDDFKSLLNKNKIFLELNHDKWYRDLSNSNITIKKQLYKLMITENKRKIIYDELSDNNLLLIEYVLEFNTV